MAISSRKRNKPKDMIFGDDLTIEWRDGTETHYPLFALRDACPCAGCVDELTGKKTLNPGNLPPDIHIAKAEYVGHYAVRLFWSDGHSSGIYTFTFLRELAGNADLLAGDPPVNRV